MTAASMRWAGLYLLLLLALSFFGVNSQRYHDTHTARSNEKQALEALRTEKRAQEAHLTNPDVVRRWALTHNMIPATSPEGAFLVAASPEPSLVEFPVGKLEVRTLWQ